MWWHWQSLNECKCGRELNPIPHGRAWVHFGDNCFGWEWVLGRFRLGCGLDVDGGCGGEHALSGHLHLPLFSLYWHLDEVCPRRCRRAFGEWWKRKWGYDGRSTGLEVHNGAIWGKLWAPEHGWDRGQPRWMDWSFNPADFFLGRHRHSKRLLSVVTGDLHLPEGDYPVKITLTESTWKRPRWPFVKRGRYAEVEPEEPVPIPGKGENSWDCGDDAIYSMSLSAATAQEAGDRFVASILERRARHGGPDWRPQHRSAA
ncbi:MAG TPA: hypothetical protein VFU47_02200 [Armatimonadota bacterium]|nr:hypothetical protein [Armatimonadota bacterium]